MVKLVDALDSKSSSERSAGSTPATRTNGVRLPNLESLGCASSKRPKLINPDQNPDESSFTTGAELPVDGGQLDLGRL